MNTEFYLLSCFTLYSSSSHYSSPFHFFYSVVTLVLECLLLTPAYQSCNCREDPNYSININSGLYWGIWNTIIFFHLHQLFDNQIKHKQKFLLILWPHALACTNSKIFSKLKISDKAFLLSQYWQIAIKTLLCYFSTMLIVIAEVCW